MLRSMMTNMLLLLTLFWVQGAIAEAKATYISSLTNVIPIPILLLSPILPLRVVKVKLTTILMLMAPTAPGILLK